MYFKSQYMSRAAMKQFSAAILGSYPLSTGYFECEFTWDKAAPSPEPGQFFTVRASEGTVPLLRRPFAFSAFDEKEGTASMIFQKRGRGTEILAAKQKGDRLDVIGPLGQSFPMPNRGEKALLVAGGIGIGPIVFLAKTLQKGKIPVIMVFGCRTASLLPSGGSFAASEAVICTDDGSRGFKGTAGDYLKSIENTIDNRTSIYACGPLPLLKACHESAVRRGCECYVSVEQVMACGVGACMGCAVKSAKGGYKRACTEGPIFNSKDLKWE
jgi:dihydroorotate dehydrogenase electron transfer subunit